MYIAFIDQFINALLYIYIWGIGTTDPIVRDDSVTVFISVPQTGSIVSYAHPFKMIYVVALIHC